MQINIKQPLSIFGATGFIGKRFTTLYPNNIAVSKESNSSPTSNILYLISTVDNYNIHSNLTIDIETNLTKFMNVLTQVKLLQEQGNTPVINFVSSWFVYGQNDVIPFNEDTSICNPTGFYSITKYCAEKLLVSFCQTFNINYRIFRLSNVLGEGDLKISKQKNALQHLIKEIVNNRDVHLYYGNVIRDYMYVDDVCHAIKHCVDVAPYNEIINIGSGKPNLFKDIIDTAIRMSNSTSNIINIEPTNFHNIVQVKNSYLDVTKLTNLGFTSKYNITDIVEKLVNHYKSLI